MQKGYGPLLWKNRLKLYFKWDKKDNKQPIVVIFKISLSLLLICCMQVTVSTFLGKIETTSVTRLQDYWFNIRTFTTNRSKILPHAY